MLSFNSNFMENWKDYPGYDGLYEVSDKGRVRRVGSRVCLMGSKAPAGARLVLLSKQNKTQLKTVARMVAQTFLPNPDKLPFVVPKDGDNKNIVLDNLKWSKQSFKTKLNRQQAQYIRDSDKNYDYLQHLFKVSRSTIQKIKQGKTWL